MWANTSLVCPHWPEGVSSYSPAPWKPSGRCYVCYTTPPLTTFLSLDVVWTRQCGVCKWRKVLAKTSWTVCSYLISRSLRWRLTLPPNFLVIDPLVDGPRNNRQLFWLLIVYRRVRTPEDGLLSSEPITARRLSPPAWGHRDGAAWDRLPGTRELWWTLFVVFSDIL